MVTALIFILAGILSAIFAWILLEKLDLEEEKFLYGNIVTLVSILIAMIAIIYSSIGSNLGEAISYDPTQISPSQANIYLMGCTLSHAPPLFNLSTYENFSFGVKAVIMKVCIQTWETKIAVSNQFIIILLLILSLISRTLLSKKLNLYKRPLLYGGVRIFMLASVILALIAQLWFILSFIYAPYLNF